MKNIRIGPLDTPLGVSYFYRIGDRLSADGYANAASARDAAKRVQLVDAHGRLTPERPGASGVFLDEIS